MRYIRRAGGHSNQLGHSAPITSVEWASDGTTLATGSYDGFVIIWDAERLIPLHRLSHSRLVNGVRWSPSGSQLAASCGDGHCYIWNASTGKLDMVLSRHTDDVNAIAWSPSGTHIVTVSEDGTGRVWALMEGDLLDIILVHSNHCMSVDWHPSGSVIATCGEDAAIRIWDLNGQLKAHWKQPSDLEMVRWGPDGLLLAAACDDGSVRILSETGELVKELGPCSAAVKSVSWNADGRQLVSGCYDGTISVWDIDKALAQSQYRASRLWPRSVHWSYASNNIAISSQDGVPAIVRLDETTIKPVSLRRLPTQGVNTIAAIADGFACGLDDGTIRIWHIGDRVRGMDDSHPCARLELGDAWQPVNTTSVYAFDDDEASLVNAIHGHPEERLLAFGCFSGDIGLLTLDGSMLVQAHVNAPINSIAWNPDGSRLAVADYSGHLTLFEWKSSKLVQIRAFRPHDAAIKSIDWLGTDHLVTAATDRRIKVVSDKGAIGAILSGHGNIINSIAVTKGAERCLIASASRDRTVRIWDPLKATCERVLVGHTASVKSVVWEPGSATHLASGSYDFDIRIWNAALSADDAGFSQVIGYHHQGVAGLAWSAAGLASGSWDASTCLWDVSTRNVAAKLECIVFDQL